MDYYAQLKRLIKINLIVYFAIFILALLFSSKILKCFGVGFEELYVFGIGDTLSTLLYIAFVIASVASLPILVFSFYKFFEDALYPHERKVVKKYIILMLLMAGFGILIGIYISRFTVYFGKFVSEMLGVKLLQSAKEIFLINFSIIFGTAICMEIFPILRILINMKVVKKESLKKNRWLFYLITYVIVAILTPGDYWFGNLILFGILVTLYEITIRL